MGSQAGTPRFLDSQPHHAAAPPRAAGASMQRLKKVRGLQVELHTHQHTTPGSPSTRPLPE